MPKCLSAFGLRLRSDFFLPGMGEREGEGLPAVTLSLVSPERLDRAWSGGLARHPWRGRLGDGKDLTIEWGHAGDLLFNYGGGARFRLDADRETVECAPGEVATLVWQRVLLSRVLPAVGLACGYEALHAGAVETAAGVVAIAAPSGMGKSTLAAELMRRGASLFADDVILLEDQGSAVVAYPGTPHMNYSENERQSDELGIVLGTLAGESWVSALDYASEPRSLTAIAFLDRAPGLALAVEWLDPNPLALAPFMLGLPDEEEGREANRFALYSDLVGETRLLRLTAAPDRGPAELAEVLEDALAVNHTGPIGEAA